MWVLVQAGSHFLSDAESQYAVIELEMLAVSWATSKYVLAVPARLPQFIVNLLVVYWPDIDMSYPRASNNRTTCS